MKLEFNVILILFLACNLCGCSAEKGWSRHEKQLINGENSTMRVLTVYDKEDSVVLRKPCSDMGKEMIAGPEYRRLEEKMIATVTSPEQDGVGIAGPQVGISRRIVAVQRFDKETEPFEVYPNIRIIERRGEKQDGNEGCLSVPGMKGTVPRYQDISISYTSTRTFKDTTENVKGFTAVIFQHETDHLDGIIYTDYL
ncbi:MAG: peptide deformylase [Bacteroidales bacterium]|nr:peptide deformylase [Bacteroidales bacterium]